MAHKQSKQKQQNKTKGRNKKIKLADLNAPKGGAVKGGALYMKYGDLK